MTDKIDIDNVRYSFETQEFFQRQIEEAINTLINEKIIVVQQVIIHP